MILSHLYNNPWLHLKFFSPFIFTSSLFSVARGRSVTYRKFSSVICGTFLSGLVVLLQDGNKITKIKVSVKNLNIFNSFLSLP